MSGTFLKYNGTDWAGTAINIGDLKSTVAGSLFSSPNCTAAQTLTWSAVSDQFSCAAISISGSAVSGGTIGGATAINTTGTITTTGAITGASFSGTSVSGKSLYVYDSDSTNSVLIQTPATGVLTSDYTLTLPSTDGDPGQLLSTDGSGGLSWVTGGAGGETNTASNIGTAGVGVYKQKSGVDIELKKINAGSSKVSITDDTGNNEIDVDVVEANLTLTNLGGTLSVAKGGTGVTSLPSTFVLNGGQAGAVVLGSSDSNTVTFNSNGSARVTINSSGRVGIGTTNPSSAILDLGDSSGSSIRATGHISTAGNFKFHSLTNGMIWNATGTAGSNIVIAGGDTNSSYLELAANANVGSTTTADYIRFTTKNRGTEAMRIISSGNVGIGITNPGTALDVSGTVRGTGVSGKTFSIVDSDATNSVLIQTPATGVLTSDYTLTLPSNDGDAGQVLSTNGSGVLSWVAAGGGSSAAGSTGQVQFNSSNAFAADSNLYWDNTNKRLGIGTSSPSHHVHLSGADDLAIRMAGTAGGGSTVGPSNPTTSGTNTDVGTVSWTTTSSAYASDNAYAEAASLPSSGGTSRYLTLTGFGFSIPAGAAVDGVEVVVERKASGMTVYDNSIKLLIAGTVSGTNQSAGLSWSSISDTSVTYGGVSNTWGLTLTGADVNSSTFGVAISAINNGISTRTAQVDHVTVKVYYTDLTGIPNWTIGADRSDSGKFKVSNSAGLGSGDIITIDGDNGRVGIGTTSPTHELHVIGTAGLSTGTAWTNASDGRLKDIRGNYARGLNEILQLNTIRFNYKKGNPLGLPHEPEIIGFVAQKVQKVIPEAIHVREQDGYLELNVDPIHWATVNAVKELYYKLKDGLGEVVNLKTSVVNQSRRIASLEAENAKLNDSINQQEQKIKDLELQNRSIKEYICAKDPAAVICK